MVGMDAFLHRRTQASTEGLRARLASRATVIRDSTAVDIPVEEVVPGDLALVSASEHFPADGVLVEGGLDSSTGIGLQGQHPVFPDGRVFPRRHRHSVIRATDGRRRAGPIPIRQLVELTSRGFPGERYSRPLIARHVWRASADYAALLGANGTPHYPLNNC